MSDVDTLFEFPCEFPVKAMGRSDAGIEDTVLDIINRHSPDFDERNMRVRTSSNGRFISVTVSILAQSREQLDAIYLELSGHPDILYAF